jgi:hypothetical protein
MPLPPAPLCRCPCRFAVPHSPLVARRSVYICLCVCLFDCLCCSQFARYIRCIRPVCIALRAVVFNFAEQNCLPLSQKTCVGMGCRKDVNRGQQAQGHAASSSVSLIFCSVRLSFLSFGKFVARGSSGSGSRRQPSHSGRGTASRRTRGGGGGGSA